MNWKFAGDRPVYQQIMENIRGAVLRGELPPGGRVPSVRELAMQAQVNPNTMQRALTELEREGLRPDVVVVDPPRKGLAADVVDTIAAMGPERVVYVSCDPATLGRDVGRFAALGYTAVAAEAVDLFPRTKHVECVVKLVREA